MTRERFPVVTGEQMAAVDRAMVEVCGLELLQVMEVAGRAVAIVARYFYRQQDEEKPVAILCGSGGNGGDGLVAGKYLAGWGIPVELWLVRSSDEMSGLAGHQLDVARRIGLPIIEPGCEPDFGHAGLIIDGLFGFGLTSAPRGRAASLIESANIAVAPIVAIDIPSGIDSTSGGAKPPAIVADWTVTLGLPKRGLVTGTGIDHVGEVIVADIGIPAAAYIAVGIPETDLFHSVEFANPDGTHWFPDRF